MQYKKIKLKNGLRVITAPVKGTATATVMVMVGVGSRYESAREAGLSHFIEHMLFKGTQKRPTYLQIAEELDAIGGESNAFTGKDKTAYYAKADARHIGTALDVIADMYLNSTLEEAEIKKESGTIIQEINMYEDSPTRNVGNIFEQLMYADNPLGGDIAGSKKTVASFKRKDFIDYMERFYVANDTVVCVAGKFDEKKTVAQLEKYFAGMRRGKKPVMKKVVESQKKPGLKIRFKKTDQTHLVLGVRAYDDNHKDRFVLSVMSVILGGNMSSRIFGEVREKRGLAYYVRTNVDAYQDCGYLATSAGVEHKNLELAVKTILDEYKKIALEPVVESELRKAKDYIKGRSVMNLESSDEVAMFLIEQETDKKKIMTIKEIFARIDKVTAGDILRVAKDIFQEQRLNLAIIGPHKDNDKIREVLKF
ncbi:MAG: pitrilysin family protein [Candidatus Moranbacteria bacterium]|nr:pitrilysin family protein [Candidatus Moranbacteria bacterium]